MELNKKRFILSLLVVFIIGTFFSAGLHIFVEYVRNEQREIFVNNIGIIENILKADINFLKARRAEKNLIIFKDTIYEEQAMSYAQQAKDNILKMKTYSHDDQDIGIANLLENNINIYYKLFEDLSAAVNLDTLGSDEINLISGKIAQLNDIFTENVETVLQRQSANIEQGRITLDKYFTLVKHVLIILLPIIIMLGYLVGNIIFSFDMF